MPRPYPTNVRIKRREVVSVSVMVYGVLPEDPDSGIEAEAIDQAQAAFNDMGYNLVRGAKVERLQDRAARVTYTLGKPIETIERAT